MFDALEATLKGTDEVGTFNTLDTLLYSYWNNGKLLFRLVLQYRMSSLPSRLDYFLKWRFEVAFTDAKKKRN